MNEIDLAKASAGSTEQGSAHQHLGEAVGQHIPDDAKMVDPNYKEQVTISKADFTQMQETIRLLSQQFQHEVVHPTQPVQPAQAVITADSNAAKPEQPKEVILEEVDAATLFNQNPWRIGAKVRVSEKYPQIQGGVNWKGRVGTITKITKSPSGVKVVEVAFGDVQVPFQKAHPTKPGIIQKGYRIQKAVQTFDDSCLEPIYE
jgi:hypothetical protein